MTLSTVITCRPFTSQKTVNFLPIDVRAEWTEQAAMWEMHRLIITALQFCFRF